MIVITMSERGNDSHTREFVFTHDRHGVVHRAFGRRDLERSLDMFMVNATRREVEMAIDITGAWPAKQSWED